MSETLKSGIPCRCGRWAHRAIRAVVVRGAPAGAVSLQVDERECPKCRSWYLLVYRVTTTPESVASWLVPMTNPTEAGLRRALAAIVELTAADVSEIVDVARRMSQTEAA